MKNLTKYTLSLIMSLGGLGYSGTITIVGNGAGGGPIFVTSKSASIDIGTQVRIGTFTDLTVLNNAISAFTATSGAADFATTLNALNNNFVDLGTSVTNYGASSQVANGGAAFTPSTSRFGFNNITSLTVNGVTGNWNTFNGSMTSVNYSLSIGASKSLYFWTAFNNEIAIVRDASGAGTAAWTTPSSDASNLTLNMSGLQATAGGTMQASDVLLGKIVEYGSGPDLIQLIPEPSTSSLILVSVIPFLVRRRKLGSNKVGKS